VRRLLLLVSAVVFYNTLFSAALAPYLPDLASEFGLSKTEAGILVAAHPAGLLIGAIPGGLLAARLGVKPTMLLGLALMVGSTIAFALAPTLWLLAAARFGQGLSVAASWTSALTWLVGAGPRARRGELIGHAARAAVLGVLLGPVLGAAAGLAGRGPVFGSGALLGIAIAAWAWATSGFSHTARERAGALLAALEPRAAGGLWLGTLTALLIGVLSVLAPLALDRAGWGTIGVGAVFLVGGAAHAVVSPSVGRVADRRGRLAPVRAGLVTTAAVSITIPWIHDRWPLAVLVVAAGVSYALFWVPGVALLVDGAEAAQVYPGFGFMLMNLAWAPGQFAGAAGGGALADAFGDAVPFLLLAALSLLTLLAVHVAPRRVRERRAGAPVRAGL
jgi:predicted MFS family arabinose efflux permease